LVTTGNKLVPAGAWKKELTLALEEVASF